MIKPYVLTPEQKEELIALCNKTFPELSWHFWIVDIPDTDDCMESDKIGYNHTFHLATNEEFPALEIHWFEFVIRMIIDEDLSEFNDFFEKITGNEDIKGEEGSS